MSGLAIVRLRAVGELRVSMTQRRSIYNIRKLSRGLSLGSFKEYLLNPMILNTDM